VGFLVTILLQIYERISRGNNCENQLRFDRDITMSRPIVPPFYGTRCNLLGVGANELVFRMCHFIYVEEVVNMFFLIFPCFKR